MKTGVGAPIKDNQIKSRLTEQSVEVSVFAWHGDDDRFQTFLGPHLQTFQPGPIHFLRGLKPVHTAPHAISPGEEEQSRPSEDYMSLFLGDLLRELVGTETQNTTPTKVERLIARGWKSEFRKTHNILLNINSWLWMQQGNAERRTLTCGRSCCIPVM